MYISKLIDMIEDQNRHRLNLMVAGVLYSAIGVILMVTPLTTEKTLALHFALMLAPADFWASVFVMVGSLTFFSSVVGVQNKKLIYSILSMISIAWGLFYICGVTITRSPATNLTYGIVWILIGFLWWSTSSMTHVKPPDWED